MARLPDRYTCGSGQGGGGALSKKELADVLRISSSNPLLAIGTILHTDRAKAYMATGPLHHPEAGALQDGHLVNEYAHMCYTHTTVTHKRKPGKKGEKQIDGVHYTKKMEVTLFDGRKMVVKGGTQIVDGFWAYLRKQVGRTGLHSGDAASATRTRLYQIVRHFQWQYWHLEKDRFVLFCELIRARRSPRGPVFFV